MTNVIRDENFVHAISGVSYVDGITVVPIIINASNVGVNIDRTSTVSTAAMNAARDANHRAVLMGVDSVSGSPIPIFVNPTTGGILVGSA